MKNRINPGIPPSRRPGATTRDDGSNPLDRVAKVSHALKEMLRQKAHLGSLCGNAAVYDLTAIWRAAKADPGNQGRDGGRVHMTPRQFVEDFDHIVTSLDDGDPGKILADGRAAVAYCSHVDTRVQIANGEYMMQQANAATKSDPIQAGVDACEGGAFGLMFAAIEATARTGMSPEGYFAAVLERAKEQALGMDAVAAESLVSDVQKAIAGCPDLEKVVHRGPFPDSD